LALQAVKKFTCINREVPMIDYRGQVLADELLQLSGVAPQDTGWLLSAPPDRVAQVKAEKLLVAVLAANQYPRPRLFVPFPKIRDEPKAKP
jgi:hypothetical protein